MPPAFRPVRPKPSGVIIQLDGFRDALGVHCCLGALRQLFERFGIRILRLLVVSRLIADCHRLADFAAASRSLGMRKRHQTKRKNGSNNYSLIPDLHFAKSVRPPLWSCVDLDLTNLSNI